MDCNENLGHQDFSLSAYEFHDLCTVKAHDLCTRLKEDSAFQYNPYEWMFTDSRTKYNLDTKINFKKTDVCISETEETKEFLLPTEGTKKEDFSDEIMEVLIELKESIHAVPCPPDPIVKQAMDHLCQSPVGQVSVVCEQLEISTLNEDVVEKMSEMLVKHSTKWSISGSQIVIGHLFVKKLVSGQKLSRMLTKSLSAIVVHFPNQCIKGLIVPALEMSAKGEPLTENLDTLCKVVDEKLLKEEAAMLLDNLVNMKLIWNRPILIVVHGIVNKVPLRQTSLTNLILRCSSDTKQFEEEVKFAQLIHRIVNKYGDSLSTCDLKSIENALESNKTYLKSSVFRSLSMLKIGRV